MTPVSLSLHWLAASFSHAFSPLLTLARVCSEAPPQLLRLTLWGYFAYSPSNPCQNRHGHTISKGFVSRSVCGWLAIVFNGCVSIWKALKSLTFQWREAPHGHSLSNPRSYRMAGVVAHTSERWRKFLSCVGTVIFLAEGNGVLFAGLERKHGIA